MQDTTSVQKIWGMVTSSTLQASVFMGKNYSEFLRSITNTGKDLTMKQMSMVNDEDVISLSHAMLNVFSDSVLMSWKGESEPSIKFCLGGTVELVQKFITIQNIGHNRRKTDGIRVEYFPRIHYIAALQQSPRVHV